MFRTLKYGFTKKKDFFRLETNYYEFLFPIIMSFLKTQKFDDDGSFDVLTIPIKLARE